MNIVALSGRLAGLPRLTYTKNGKPQTGFDLIVPNDDSPGYFTRESVLLVGGRAEHFAEKLDAGAEVELSGKLQRGQVVCFRVRIWLSASPQDDAVTGDLSVDVRRRDRATWRRWRDRAAEKGASAIFEVETIIGGGELSRCWRDVLVFAIWLLVFTVLGWAILLIM